MERERNRVEGGDEREGERKDGKRWEGRVGTGL